MLPSPRVPLGDGHGARDSLSLSRLRSLIAFFLKQSSGIYLDDYRSFVDLALSGFPLRQSWPLDLLPCSVLRVFPMWRAGRFPAAVAEADSRKRRSASGLLLVRKHIVEAHQER